MPARPLNRPEIADLAERVRGVLAIVEADEMSATTAMTYWIQGRCRRFNKVAPLPVGQSRTGMM